MENGKNGTQNSVRKIMGNHQLIIITRLLKVVETMGSIDELFEWLSETIMQRMDVPVVQFWAMQAYRHGRVSCELRSMACQNALLPQHIVVNQPLADTVERLLNKQQSVTPQLVDNIFSQYHSKLLIRYNLNYWGCHIMSNAILLPPTKNDFSHDKVATPLKLGITAFLQHTPSTRLIPTLAHILEHVLPIAKSRGLLKITNPPKLASQLTISQYTEKRSMPTEFTPHRTQADYTAKYAAIGESIIRDKNARRLYLAIDGQKNIGELASVLLLDAREFHAALSLLLTQKRIQIFEPGKRTGTSFEALQSFQVPRIT